MKTLRILIIGILITGLFACGGNTQDETNEKDSMENTTTMDQPEQELDIVQVAEVGCAQCQMGLPCDEHKLAVKIEDNVYYVEGVAMENLAEYDYCSVIKKAKLKGHIVDTTFLAETIEFTAE